MEKEELNWTVTHNHATGDFVCDFGSGLTVSYVSALKTAYKQKDGATLEKFSTDGMHIDVFHRILVGIAKSVS